MSNSNVKDDKQGTGDRDQRQQAAGQQNTPGGKQPGAGNDNRSSQQTGGGQGSGSGQARQGSTEKDQDNRSAAPQKGKDEATRSNDPSRKSGQS
jgi:hypothetical protein